MDITISVERTNGWGEVTEKEIGDIVEQWILDMKDGGSFLITDYWVENG